MEAKKKFVESVNLTVRIKDCRTQYKTCDKKFWCVPEKCTNHKQIGCQRQRQDRRESTGNCII